MGAEPDAGFALYIFNKLAQRDYSRAMSDVVRMHRQYEYRSFLVRQIEFIPVTKFFCGIDWFSIFRFVYISAISDLGIERTLLDQTLNCPMNTIRGSFEKLL